MNSLLRRQLTARLLRRRRAVERELPRAARGLTVHCQSCGGFHAFRDATDYGSRAHLQSEQCRGRAALSPATAPRFPLFGVGGPWVGARI